jgi:hypothetical protein
MLFNIYLVCSEINGQKLHKIGYTRRPIEKRIKEFKTGNASDIYLVDSFQSEWGTKIESQLHRIYKSKKIGGEWFDLSQEEIDKFKGNCERIHNNLELISKHNSYYQERGDF